MLLRLPPETVDAITCHGLGIQTITQHQATDPETAAMRQQANCKDIIVDETQLLANV